MMGITITGPKRIAVVHTATGEVQRVFDLVDIYEAPDEMSSLECGPEVQVGWIFADNTFSPPSS